MNIVSTCLLSDEETLLMGAEPGYTKYVEKNMVIDLAKYMIDQNIVKKEIISIPPNKDPVYAKKIILSVDVADVLCENCMYHSDDFFCKQYRTYFPNNGFCSKGKKKEGAMGETVD